MKHRWTLVLSTVVVAVLAAGCAQGPKRPIDSLPEESVVRMIRELSIKQTRETAGKDQWVGLVLGPTLGTALQTAKASGGVREGDGYRFDMQWWCLDPTNKRDLVTETVTAIQAHCQRRGGDFGGGFCRRTDARDEVVFGAFTSRKQDMCAYVEVNVIEPIGPRSHPAYVAALKNVGFKTVAEQQASRDAEQARQLAQGKAFEQRQAHERARHEAELPQMRKRGTTVCRVDALARVTYRGFVEDMTDEKIKINVADAFLTNVPGTRPGGFQPQMIWDFPARWRLC